MVVGWREGDALDRAGRVAVWDEQAGSLAEGVVGTDGGVRSWREGQHLGEFKGPNVKDGMPDFTNRLQPADLDKIRAFILGTADAIRPKR